MECINYGRISFLTSLKWSNAARMISCPPLTKHTAARSSRTRALVLHNQDKRTLTSRNQTWLHKILCATNSDKTFQRKIKDSKYNQSRNLQKGQVKWSYWFYGWQITEELSHLNKGLFIKVLFNGFERFCITVFGNSLSYKPLSPIDLNQHEWQTIRLFIDKVSKEHPFQKKVFDQM